jgi:hypothetical protein
MPKPDNTKPQKCFEKSGIYSLTCPDCDMEYVGQTGFHLKKGTMNISTILNIV